MVEEVLVGDPHLSSYLVDAHLSLRCSVARATAPDVWIRRRRRRKFVLGSNRSGQPPIRSRRRRHGGHRPRASYAGCARRRRAASRATHLGSRCTHAPRPGAAARSRQRDRGRTGRTSGSALPGGSGFAAQPRRTSAPWLVALATAQTRPHRTPDGGPMPVVAIISWSRPPPASSWRAGAAWRGSLISIPVTAATWSIGVLIRSSGDRTLACRQDRQQLLVDARDLEQLRLGRHAATGARPRPAAGRGGGSRPRCTPARR